MWAHHALWILLLSTGGATPTPYQLGELPDGEYRTACGPIACYIALKTVGESPQLPGLARVCDWRDGEFTEFGTLERVISGYWRANAVSGKFSPEQIKEFLSDSTRQRTAILAIRKASEDTIDHAVCVMSTNESGVVCLDYPELVQTIRWSELGERWDGHAILVSKSLSAWIVDTLPWIILPLVAALGWLIARRSSRANSSSQG